MASCKAHHQILLADQIKENEVGGACGTHGRNMYRVLVGRAEGKTHLEDEA
jgi:hypothetical protein